MKLSVQDLAMFLGCDCKIIKADIPEQYKENFSKVGDIVKIDPVLLLLMSQRNIVVKPTLRTLLDITEEEASECYNLTGERFVSNPRVALLDKTFNHRFNIDDQALIIRFLISKQFDVFRWIEKGLAIDKTKQDGK